MRNIKTLFVWENKRRIEILTKFGKNYDSYLSAKHANSEAGKYRSAMNHDFAEVRLFLKQAGSYAIISRMDPPALGGRVYDIDLLANIFRLEELEVGSKEMFDLLERSVGIYDNNHIRSIINVFNPLLYLYLVTQWVSSLPFKFLSEIGFHGDEAEASVFGKLIKGLIQFTLFTSSVFSIFEFIGISSAILSPLYKLLPFLKGMP